MEDSEHVLKCCGTGATEKWQEQVRLLRPWLVKTGTDRQIREAILKGVQAFRSGDSYTAPNSRAEVQAVVERQNQLGWRNLLEGFPVIG